METWPKGRGSPLPCEAERDRVEATLAGTSTLNLRPLSHSVREGKSSSFFRIEKKSLKVQDNLYSNSFRLFLS
jgi:hypothetical protein